MNLYPRVRRALQHGLPAAAVLTAIACSAPVLSPGDTLAAATIELNGRRGPTAGLQEAIAAWLEGGGFVVVRASCDATEAETQALLDRIWLAGAPEVVLQRCAPLGALDFDVRVVPPITWSRCPLGRINALDSPAEWLDGPDSVLLRRPSVSELAP